MPPGHWNCLRSATPVLQAIADRPEYHGIAAELRALMWDRVGLIRTEESLTEALARIRAMQAELASEPGSGPAAYDLSMADWFDLRDSLYTAEAVAVAALNRTESRGAHWREDFPATDPDFRKNQTVAFAKDGLETGWREVGAL